MRSLLVVATISAMGVFSSALAAPPPSPQPASPPPLAGFQNVEVNLNAGGAANVTWNGELSTGSTPANASVTVYVAFVVRDNEQVGDAKRRAIEAAKEKLRLALGSNASPH